jgi:hypothetical protein
VLESGEFRRCADGEVGNAAGAPGPGGGGEHATEELKKRPRVDWAAVDAEKAQLEEERQGR